ncbi:MAG TPA: isoaspartyl peptidase/L-asparaginase, partial [Patescibacteria group bacterium]|nr:isoaspartyl peptidase/L-asparaginase [Patescibacteria group bacterium]
MSKIAIAIHGGASSASKRDYEKEEAYKKSLKEIVESSYKILEEGGTAIDAVEHAVRLLEDDPLFNAGRGSGLNCNGEVEMDAAIMDGRKRDAGAVSALRHVKNPITLARTIMERTEHVLLSADGAEEYAIEVGMEMQPRKYFITPERYKSWADGKEEEAEKKLEKADEQKNGREKSRKIKEKGYGTVGAVAIDKDGNLASATSTGGTPSKMCGRVGDSPVIGAGTYANNETCAVSCTGDGEYFIKTCAAYDVSCLLEYKGLSLKEAADE